MIHPLAILSILIISGGVYANEVATRHTGVHMREMSLGDNGDGDGERPWFVVHMCDHRSGHSRIGHTQEPLTLLHLKRKLSSPEQQWVILQALGPLSSEEEAQQLARRWTTDTKALPDGREQCREIRGIAARAQRARSLQQLYGSLADLELFDGPEDPAQ